MKQAANTLDLLVIAETLDDPRGANKPGMADLIRAYVDEALAKDQRIIELEQIAWELAL